MNRSKRKYKKTYVHQKIVDFGRYDNDLWLYAKKINFSRFVKDILKESIQDPVLMARYRKDE